jgi:hypothetical protein
MLIIALATIIVFATLGALGLWMIYLLLHWLGGLIV